MERIKIESSKHKPGVLMDPDNDVINFYGFSLPEDAFDFFLPFIKWLHQYDTICEEKIKAKRTLKASFKLSYHNSASHRAFLEMFLIFKKMKEKGLDIHIEWYYENDDIIMIEAGKDLAEIANFPLKFIEFN